MAQLSIKTHDGDTFKLAVDDDKEPAHFRPPSDGFVTFRGKDATLVLHVKSIHSIYATSGEVPGPVKNL